MDYKFLDKVVDQIVSETRIDYEYMGGRISIPFLLSLPPSPLSPQLSLPSSSLSFSFFLKSFSNYFPHFSRHCEGVYGLNDDEIFYVWDQFRQIIKDKINSNE
jgi:hypothetical protein